MLALSMKRVAASEAALLTIARAVVRFESSEAAEVILRRPHELPSGFGPTALGLLEETLQKGVILELMRRGGARRRPYLSGGTVKEDRVFDRHPPPRLVFSDYPVHLLRWMTAASMRDVGESAFAMKVKTRADQLFAYLAFDLLLRTKLASPATLRGVPLVWLGFLRTFASPIGAPSKEDFVELLQGEGIVIVEALLPELARRYRDLLLDRAWIVGRTEMLRLAEAEKVVFDSFLAALDRSGRRDLARFLLEGAAEALSTYRSAARFVASLEHAGSLRERMEARRSALGFSAVLERLGHWANEARAVRFFDDEYAGAQLYLRLWEQVGETGLGRAQQLLRDVELSEKEEAAAV